MTAAMSPEPSGGGPVTSGVQPGRGRVLLLAMIFFFIGCGAGVYLHWPALTHRTIYKSDIRQAPHWAAYHRTSFRRGDLLLRYASFNESPLQNVIYYVATRGIEMIFLTKLVAVIGYGLAAALFFVAGQGIFGLRGGILCGIFFTFFPDQFDYSAGGFSKFWMIPLLMLCVWLLEARWWRGLIVLLPFAAIAYPVSGVLIGLTVTVFAGMEAVSDRREAGRILAFLAGGSVMAAALLAAKYVHPPAGIGPMTSGAEMAEMREMYRGGLNHYLPIPSLAGEVVSYIDHPFVIFGSMLYLLVLGRGGTAWRRSWTALLFASLAGYLLSDWLFMRLYVPNRYTRYSAAVLLILWHAGNCDRMLARLPGRSLRATAFLALLAVGGWAYRDTFRQGKDTTDRSRYAPLCDFLATLPDGILVAGPPKIMDDITVQARRSVLCNYKMAHPWFSEYYAEIRERTRATYRAIYAADADAVNAFMEPYGVTHLVVRRSDFSSGRLRRGRIYVEPFNKYIKRLTADRDDFFLEDPPPDDVVYGDARVMVIQLPVHRR